MDVLNTTTASFKASLPLLFLTMVATYHSAFAFLGSSGFFFKHGIGFWGAGTWTILVIGITYTYGTRIFQQAIPPACLPISAWVAILRLCRSMMSTVPGWSPTPATETKA